MRCDARRSAMAEAFFRLESQPTSCGAESGLSLRTGVKRLSSLRSNSAGIPDMRVSEYRPLRASIRELTSAHRRFVRTSYAWLPDRDALVDLNYPFPRCDLLQ